MALTVGNPPDSNAAHDRATRLATTDSASQPYRGVSRNDKDATIFVQVTAMVDRTYRHANRPILIEGDPLPVHLSRSRIVKAAK
jgi:hypothetical protein